MTGEQRRAALPDTIERLAVKNGWNISATYQQVRVGLIGEPGSRMREIAETLARESGIDFQEFWNKEVA